MMIFNRVLFLQLRIIIAVIISMLLVAFNRQSDTCNKIRGYLDIAISPFYFLVTLPKVVLINLLDRLVEKEQLIFENKVLKKEVLLKTADNLLVNKIKQENVRLRELLGLPLLEDEYIMITQVLSSANIPYQNQIIIDKGLHDGVYEGQPVISDKGVVGQVVAVSQFNSRVLLICDKTHALPIQIFRNDIRVIAIGTGCGNSLQLEFLPDNTNIHIGDLLVTSGLGGRFPEGYPVAIISNINHDTKTSYTIIYAKPIVDLQKLRYLLLWRNSKDSYHPLPPLEIYRAANKRLMKILPQKFISTNDLKE